MSTARFSDDEIMALQAGGNEVKNVYSFKGCVVWFSRLAV